MAIFLEKMVEKNTLWVMKLYIYTPEINESVRTVKKSREPK